MSAAHDPVCCVCDPHGFYCPSLDVDVQSPDEKSVITYVSTLYDAFPKVPDGVDGISPNVSWCTSNIQSSC